MKKYCLLLMLVSVNTFAQDGTKFAYLCQWKEDGVEKWEKHHVNLSNGIVDGRTAVIDDSFITFVRDNIEYKIDRSNDVLTERGLASAPGATANGPIQCKKGPPIQTDFVSNAFHVDQSPKK